MAAALAPTKVLLCLDCGGEFRPKNGKHLRHAKCSYSSPQARLRGRAHRMVYAAVLTGVLPNLKSSVVACADCGKRADRYDHRDYTKPLDVAPVCHRCNGRRGPGIAPIESETDRHISS